MDAVHVEVVPADETSQPVIRRLLELNSYDFSAIDGRDLSSLVSTATRISTTTGVPRRTAIRS